MRFWNLVRTYKGDNPSKTTTGIYCSASMFRDACYQLVSAFLITYITCSGLLDISNTAVYLQQIGVISIITILCLIWDGINDPIMGWIIEKVHFKWGKYKPWILIGALLNTGIVLTLFLARPTGWGMVALFGVFYFLWDFAWTINDIAYWSMLPSLTKNEKRRNSITTVMQIFISVGTFGIYGALNLLVGDSAASAQMIYGVAAIIVCSLYLISQILICVGCKEHERDPEIEKKEQEDVKFSDMFKLLKNNKEFRVNIIAILLQYLGSGVVVGFATYYFYLTYGYGTSADTIFMFTIMYAVGTLLAQFLYPLLNKFINRKGLFLVSSIALVVGYVAMFIFGFPIFGAKPIAQIGSWTIILLYVAGAVLFFGQGIMSIAQIVQMQSTIEYNELQTGERKEAIASSMRALVAKFGSAIQRLLIYVTLSATMLYGITQKISDLEYQKAAGSITAEEVKTQALAACEGIQSGQFLGLAIGMLLIPLVCLLVSCFLSGKIFKIDEKKYQEICAELDARKTSETTEEAKVEE